MENDFLPKGLKLRAPANDVAWSSLTNRAELQRAMQGAEHQPERSATDHCQRAPMNWP